MLKSDLVQTDKHSTKICSGGKISDFSVAQIIIQNRCVALKNIVLKPKHNGLKTENKIGCGI